MRRRRLEVQPQTKGIGVDSLYEMARQGMTLLVGPEPTAVVYEFEHYVMIILAWIW